MSKKKEDNLEIPFINPNPPRPILKKFQNKTEINVRYPLISPFTSAHIFYDPELGSVIYDVEEPILKEEEKEILKKLEEGITQLMDINLIDRKTDILSYLHKNATSLISELGIKIEKETYEKIFYYLYRNFIGLNEIEPLLRDFYIEDIECNGVDDFLYVVHRIYRNLRTNVKFNSIDSLASFVEKLAQKCGKYISYASPILDGSLPDGSRVNATYTTDITSKGPTFTIRKFTKIPWTPIQLISFGSVSPEMLAYFWILLQYKCNILITGGTGSGKTTLLNALAFFIPPEARVVSIEDTRELNLSRENWLPSVARSGLAGVGEVDLFSLLKASFRQNPDYVIVGEVRGKEAYVLFQGMASGHPSLSTIHADSVDSVVKRLQTPPISLSPTLINTLDVIGIMSHAIVKNQETRKLKEVSEIVNVSEDGSATINTLFIWEPKTDRFFFKLQSKVFEKIISRYGLTREEIVNEFNLRTKLLYQLYKKKIFDFDVVQKIINDYYKNPQAVLSNYDVS